MLTFDSAATRQALPFSQLTPALASMFQAGCEVPDRHIHSIGEAGTVLLMPAWQTGKFLGIKTVSVFPGNRKVGKSALHSTYMLFDANTGEPIAQLCGNEITSRRTVAASALAASYLARSDASRLLVVGAGQVASLIAEAMAAVRTIQSIEVWNHRLDGAEKLAKHLCNLGFDARPVADLPRAVGRADIVSCATLATTPLILGKWLEPGTHLDLIGSFTPQMCEADPECFARSLNFIDTDEAMKKSGDVLQAMAASTFQKQGTLQDLCRAAVTGRRSKEDITLFKSVGTALEDLAAAQLAWRLLGAKHS